MDVTGRIGSVRWKVESADSTLFYGVAMDGTQGIAVDNFRFGAVLVCLCAPYLSGLCANLTNCVRTI